MDENEEEVLQYYIHGVPQTTFVYELKSKKNSRITKFYVSWQWRSKFDNLHKYIRKKKLFSCPLDIKSWSSWKNKIQKDNL